MVEEAGLFLTVPRYNSSNYLHRYTRKYGSECVKRMFTLTLVRKEELQKSMSPVAPPISASVTFTTSCFAFWVVWEKASINGDHGLTQHQRIATRLYHSL